MDVSTPFPNAAGFLDRLCLATNAHDLDGIAACFTADYRNETPVHPERGFVGREQVRRNWQQILANVPDVTTNVLASAVDGHVVWSEWEHRGTRPDGSAHLMRGVIVFGVRDGCAEWARLFLEPVVAATDAVDEVVRRQVRAPSPS